MITRKIAGGLVATTVGLLTLFGLAAPATATAPTLYTNFTPTVSLPVGSQFIAGQLSPILTVTLSSTPAVNTSSTFTEIAVRLNPIDKYSHYWELQQNILDNCKGDYYAMSALEKCGLSITVDGTSLNRTDATVHSGAFVEPGGDVFILIRKSVISDTISKSTIAITLDAGVYKLPAFESTSFLVMFGEYYREPTATYPPLQSWTGGYPAISVVVPSKLTFEPYFFDTTGSMDPVTHSGTVALPPNGFTRDGYTFAGWATSRVNAALGTVAYRDLADYTFGTEATLYAVWVANTPGGESGSSDRLATTGYSNLLVNVIFASSLLLLGAAMVLARRFSK